MLLLTALALTLCPPQGIRITCVHDGDSIVWNRERIRIENIDTPELNGKCPSERALALRARDRLLQLLNSGEVEINRRGKDRYERTLARVTVDGRDVGEILVAEKLARVWSDRREGWCR